MKTINCPSCAGEVQIKIKQCKLISCDYCGSPLLLEDDSVKNIGEQSSLAEIPSILKLGVSFEYRNTRFIPYGHIQYDYGDGLWEEWWVITAKQSGFWISIDEGEIAIQTVLTVNEETQTMLSDFKRLKLGDQIYIDEDNYQVTEKNSARCSGIEGQLPKVVLPGDKMDYIDFSSPKGDILTAEYDNNGLHLYKGSWIDPFELKAL